MAFPTSLTNAQDGVTDVLAAHINAVEAKIGVDGSAVTTSHDYKLSEVTSSDKAVGKTATQTLSNKTLTSPGIPTFSTLNAPEGFLINGKIVPSVASNNLTVAIKGMDGNDPSASNPVYIRIGDTVRAITSALSVTKNAGTNWCNAGSSELATKEIDYFVYIGYNATDGVVVGFSRIPYATLYSDFSATTTNEKYAAISTITNAAAGDNYQVIGRFAATLSAGAGYTWSVPTFTGTNLIQRPIYESRRLSWSPTLTGFSGTPTTYTATYSVIGTRVRYELYFSGTSNAADCVASLPFNAYPSNSGACPFYAPVTNNGTWEDGVASVYYNSKSLNFGKDTSSIAGNAYAGFTTSGSKGAFVYDAFFDLI